MNNTTKLVVEAGLDNISSNLQLAGIVIAVGLLVIMFIGMAEYLKQ